MGKTWKRDHDPLEVPLGCNGKPGDSGRSRHRWRNEPVCDKCREAFNHYRREQRRGQGKPRILHPCGTRPAAARHRKNNEPLDFACRLAEARYNSQQRKAKKEKIMECEHPDISSQGVCLDCEQPVPNWEPNDAQIFAHFGQTKEIQKAA